MSNTSAHALLKDIWGNRKFSVDPIWIANKLRLDVVETTSDDDVLGVLPKEPEQDPVTILNHNNNNVRRQLTRAHELEYYVKWTENGRLPEYEFVDYRGKLTSQGVDSEEVFVNNFTAYSLMLERKVWHLSNAGYALVMMASHFDVSNNAIHCHLKNLGSRWVMASRPYTISKKLKQVARQARGEPASGSSPSAKTPIYLNDKDPAKAHQRARTKDLKADTELKKMFARWFTSILIDQLLVMSGIFVPIGAKLLHFSDFVINLFMEGTLAGVFGIVLVMACYLFSKYV